VAPPLPQPAGDAHTGSKTVFNLERALRRSGDGGIDPPRARYGPRRLKFENTPFRIPMIPVLSPPCPAPMTTSPSASMRGARPPVPTVRSMGQETTSIDAGVPQQLIISELPSAPEGPWSPPTVMQSNTLTPLPVPCGEQMEAREAASGAAAAVLSADGEVLAPLSAAPDVCLARPFPPAPTTAKQASGSKKRTFTRWPGATAGGSAKEAKNATNGVPGDGASTAKDDASTPEAQAAWNMVSNHVKKAVKDESKALWAAMKTSEESIAHLRSSLNRLEARVDAQGQGYERTAMAKASIRVAASRSVPKRSPQAERAPSSTVQSGSDAGSGSAVPSKDNDASKAKDVKDVKDVKPVLFSKEGNVAGMEAATDYDVKASLVRKHLRDHENQLIASAAVSRNIHMDAETVTQTITDHVIKVYDVTAEEAHSYFMNRPWFSSSKKGSSPIRKGPMVVIAATIPHTIAAIREFALEAYSKSLGISHKPLAKGKAEKWFAVDKFITSYKGENVLVAAAQTVFMKIGGAARIVKDTVSRRRFHVDMLAGHHALLASFVRKELRVTLNQGKRGRVGSDKGVYQNWVDEFTVSIAHLRKNHKNKNIEAGYRIFENIDPDVIVCSSDGVWTFATPQDQSPPPSPPAPTRAVVKKTTSVPASTSIGATAAASSASTMGTTDTPPRVACAPVTPLLSCANDAGVEVCGGLLVEGDEMPPPTILAIVPDDESA